MMLVFGCFISFGKQEYIFELIFGTLLSALEVLSVLV